MAQRRPCRNRSSSGPMNGASSANGRHREDEELGDLAARLVGGDGEDRPGERDGERGVAHEVDEVQLDEPREAALAGSGRVRVGPGPAGAGPAAATSQPAPRPGCRARRPARCAMAPIAERVGGPPAGGPRGPRRQRSPAPPRSALSASAGSPASARDAVARDSPATRPCWSPGGTDISARLARGRQLVAAAGEWLDQPVRDQGVEAALALDLVVGQRLECRSRHRRRRSSRSTASRRHAAGGRCPPMPGPCGPDPRDAGRPASCQAHRSATGQSEHRGAAGGADERAQLHDRHAPACGPRAASGGTSPAATVSSARVGDGAAYS